MYWNEYETKSENKNTTNKYIYFLQSRFVGVNRLFVLTYSNQDENVKRYIGRRYDLRKGIFKNYIIIIISGKNFYDQRTVSDVTQYKEIRNLTTIQGKGYSTGFLFDYDYIKNYYRLTAVDLSKQKELDSDPKAIQQR